MRKLLVILCLLSLFVVVMPLFAQDDMTYTVMLGGDDTLGPYLVDSNGMTLYLFTRDPLGQSVCSGRCLERWPALTVDSADAVTADPAIPGEVGTITRDDGTLQVTYNDIPLYYWFDDKAPGDTSGNAVGNVWWVVPPAVVYAWETPDLGNVLVGTNGMTLYTFTNDTDGTSTCYDQCATNWPPLTVASADDLVLGVNLPGDLGTTERTDGTLQVTYNGAPLYYFAKDAARGDTTGEGAGEKWYTVVPETVTVANSDEYGPYLTSTPGMTLYTFKNDSDGVSTCTGDCATAWPPFTIGASDRLAAPADVMGTLGTITRDDGSIQVTYNGMPLYYYSDDKAPGDTNGQEVGNSWFIVSP